MSDKDNIDKDRKEKDNKQGDDEMATIFFNDDITLDDSAIKKLADKIDEDIRNNAVFEHVDVKKKIKEGTKILKQFLSH